jgi:hypothetical protein
MGFPRKTSIQHEFLTPPERLPLRDGQPEGRKRRGPCTRPPFNDQSAISQSAISRIQATSGLTHTSIHQWSIERQSSTDREKQFLWTRITSGVASRALPGANARDGSQK